MLTGSKLISKLVFWIENVLFIFMFFLYEMLLTPLVFVKVLINIFSMCEMKSLIQLVLFWLLFGFVYLIFAVFKDCYYFVKILCNTQEEEDSYIEKQEEDFKQDKIVIYNEVIDVMRSVMLLFKRKKDANKKKNFALAGRSMTKAIEQMID